jgi:arylsulfatase A-like enzyme
LLTRVLLQVSTSVVLVVLAAVFGACGRSPAPRKNLLVISIDTLRADRLGAYGHYRPTSPRMDEFLATAVTFDDAQVHASWTVPSLASWMTSTLPSQHGAERIDSRLSDESVTLAEVLRDSGYGTASAFAQVFMQPKLGLLQGIEEFDDVIASIVRDGEHAAKHVTSHQVASAAAARLEKFRTSNSPWFLWVHFLDPHAAYIEHVGITSLFGGATPSERYDGEIRFTDHYVGVVLDALRHYELDSNTIVVLLSDHGEEFEDHGGYEHGHTLHFEQLRVPFAIRAPGIAPRRVPDLVRAIDLAPTLVELLDLPQAAGSTFTGRSLGPLLRGESLPPEPAFAEIGHLATAAALITERYKLIVEFSGDGGVLNTRLYDRIADPLERRDLAETKAETVEQMNAALRLVRRNAAQRRVATSNKVDLSGPETEAKRQLGYVK